MKSEHILKLEIVRREQAEVALKQLEFEFETRLIELTSELSQANEALREQIIRHQEIEFDLRETVAGQQVRLEEVSARLNGSEESLQAEVFRRLSTGESPREERTVFEKRTGELMAKILDPQTNLERMISQREEAQRELQVLVDARDTEVAFTRALLKDETSQRRLAEDALNQATKKLAAWVCELEQVNREISMLGNLGDKLQACRTAEDAYVALTRHAPELFPNDAGLIGVTDTTQDIIEVVVDWGRRPAGERRFEAADCWALRRGRAHEVEDTGAGLLCRHLPRPLPSSYICMPVIAQGSVLGVIHLGQQEPGCLSESKRHAVASVAETLGLALTQAMFHQTLLSQSIRDPLTRLFSRRFMEESLTLELSRSARTNMPLGVMMLAIDFFEDFIDAFGRDASDAILTEFSFLLQNGIRNEDIACRYGTSTFAVILPDTALDVALDRTAQIREAVKSLRLFTGDRRVDEITVSCGVAVFPDHGANGDALLNAAGEALSRAQQQGPDQLVIKPYADPRLQT